MKKTVLIYVFLSALYAQAPQTVSRTSTSPSVDANLPTQKIGVDDLISISVADLPELTRTFRVSADGTLPLPMITERIRASGKYPVEVEASVSAALVQEQILVRPVVSVSVVEYRSRPVSVMGAVRHPITFQAIGELTLLDALTKADGLSPEAGPEILVSRPHSAIQGTTATLVQRIPVRALLDAADAALNVKLYGGEEIRIPEAGKVYVVGNVKKPGVFAVQDGTETSVLKMLAMSEGLLPYTYKQAFIYRREAGSNNRNEISIALSRIIDRKSPDVLLQPDDVLYIPDNKGRRMTMGALERVVGFGSSTASGLLIWGRR